MKRLALLLVACSTVLAGCQTTRVQTVQPVEQSSPSGFTQFLRAAAGPGPGLAYHDPVSGDLFSQIPAWDNAAAKRCCSVLPRTEFIALKCDTDQPLQGRTNRC